VSRRRAKQREQTGNAGRESRQRCEQPNATQEQTGGCCRGSALPRLALLESMCQRRSEDFVPPAAQRKAVSPTTRQSASRAGRRAGGGSRSVRSSFIDTHNGLTSPPKLLVPDDRFRCLSFSLRRSAVQERRRTRKSLRETTQVHRSVDATTSGHAVQMLPIHTCDQPGAGNRRISSSFARGELARQTSAERSGSHDG